MQNRFNNNDFEHFVKQNADQYRMFPSDKVWKGIHNTLHTRRRWYGIGLALLLLTTGVVTWVMFIPSAKNRQVADTLPEISSIKLPVIEKKQPAKLAVVPKRTTSSKTSFTISTDNLPENLFIASNNNMPDAEASGITEGTTALFVSMDPVMENPVPVVKVDAVHYPESIAKTSPAATRSAASNRPVASKSPAQPVQVNNYSFAAPTVNAENKETVPVKDNEEKAAVKQTIYPYTIESVINSYTRITKRKRVSLQVFVTPTISYRELKENKPYIDYARNAINGTSAAFYSVDINNVVTHKPDLGLQLGFSAGYPLSRKVKLIGGLQFNISKYDIKAYNHSSEVATISLSSAGGNNTVSTLTNYRNNGGTTGANWLHNLYFSASVPVGFEVKLMSNKKGYLGMSGTVQPTYILSNRSYLISSDYKNYAEVPSLTRKWNVNTGFELFAGYTTGGVSWRVGPQVRYQAMSSFENKYPIKEHLFDFGLKLGVMLNK